VAKVDKQCVWFFMTTGRGNFCVGADAIPALFGWEMGVPLRRPNPS
jgi:spermidine dehydrogenase